MLKQNPFPHDGTRTCTFPGHVGENPLPASADYFPVRKSGAKAGSFIGWCRDCQKLSAKRNAAEPERQGTRNAGRLAPAAPAATFGLLPGSYVAPEAPAKAPRKPRATKPVSRPDFCLADLAALNA